MVMTIDELRSWLCEQGRDDLADRVRNGYPWIECCRQLVDSPPELWQWLARRVNYQTDAAGVLKYAPDGQLTPSHVNRLVDLVVGPSHAARLLRDAPPGRLTPEQVDRCLELVSYPGHAAWLLYQAPPGRLTAEQIARLRERANDGRADRQAG